MANISKIKLPDGVTYNLKDSVSGYVTTDTKNTAGATSTTLVGSNKLYLVGALTQSTYAETGTTSGTYVNSSGLHTSGTLAIQQLGGNYSAVLEPVSTLSNNRVYELPDKGGVLALTNDLPEYNVSTDTITVAGIEADGITVSGMGILVESSDTQQDAANIAIDNTDIVFTNDDVTTNLAAGAISLIDGTDSVNVAPGALAVGNSSGDVGIFPNAITFSDGTYSVEIVSDTLTDNQTLTLPNDSGTIALAADIPTNVSAFTNDAGYMTGMTILSYGSSTWQNFIDAYTDNKVVYTRASSNANPATGSQTRLAFMAYVNNATTPTEVEFQYYRSVSSHSASQQGDQVYVYKLTKTGGWTVTVREAMSKIAVADGLTTSYASGTITISGADKQETLVSGTNIKTINNESLLGSGNVAVQPTLVSGTNIKTVNNESLLGSGNVSIQGGTSISTVQVSITVANWNATTTCTKSVTGVTASNSVIVSPTPASMTAYTSSGVYCSAQASGTLTFTASSTPTADITVNVMIVG